MNQQPPPPSYEDPDKNKNIDPGYNTQSYGFAGGHNESASFGASGFDNDQVRGRFVKKVMGILGIQLLITFGMTVAASSACQERDPLTKICSSTQVPSYLALCSCNSF